MSSQRDWQRKKEAEGLCIYYVRYRTPGSLRFKFAGPYTGVEVGLQKAGIEGYVGITDVTVTTRRPK